MIPIDDADDTELPDLGDPAEGQARAMARMEQSPTAKAAFEAMSERIEANQELQARIATNRADPSRLVKHPRQR